MLNFGTVVSKEIDLVKFPILESVPVDVGNFSIPHQIFDFIDLIFFHLDPSLLQNAILGSFVLLIFLGEQLMSKSETAYARLVVMSEVLNIKNVAVFGLIGLVVLAFSLTALEIGEHNVSIKFWSFIFILGFICLVIRQIVNGQDYFGGERTEYDIRFFKKVKSTLNPERMVRAWESLWQTTIEHKEKELTELFFSQLNELIEEKRWAQLTQLMQSYFANIDFRNKWLVLGVALPKMLALNKKISENTNIFEAQNDTNTFPLDLLIVNTFIPKVVAFALEEGGSYELYRHMDKYLIDLEEDLRVTEDANTKKRISLDINAVFTSLLESLFDNPLNKRAVEEFWDRWKVKSSNASSLGAKICMNVFLDWSWNKLIGTEGQERDSNMSRIVRNIFPDVRGSLFSIFLALYTKDSLDLIIEHPLSFYFFNGGVGFSIDSDWSEEKIEVVRVEKQELRDKNKNEETVKVIKIFFSNWVYLKISEEETYTIKELPVAERRDAHLEIIRNKIANDIKELNTRYKNTNEEGGPQFRRKENVVNFLVFIKENLQDIFPSFNYEA